MHPRRWPADDCGEGFAHDGQGTVEASVIKGTVALLSDGRWGDAVAVISDFNAAGFEPPPSLSSIP